MLLTGGVLGADPGFALTNRKSPKLVMITLSHKVLVKVDIA